MGDARAVAGLRQGRPLRVMLAVIVAAGLLVRQRPVHATPAIQLLSTAEYAGCCGYRYVVGEVQNVGSENAEYVRLNFEYRSSSNQLLATDYTYSRVDKLAPGEKSPF